MHGNDNNLYIYIYIWTQRIISIPKQQSTNLYAYKCVSTENYLDYSRLPLCKCFRSNNAGIHQHISELMRLSFEFAFYMSNLAYQKLVEHKFSKQFNIPRLMAVARSVIIGSTININTRNSVLIEKKDSKGPFL